jgi:hypothetical protein
MFVNKFGRKIKHCQQNLVTKLTSGVNFFPKSKKSIKKMDLHRHHRLRLERVLHRRMDRHGGSLRPLAQRC